MPGPLAHLLLQTQGIHLAGSASCFPQLSSSPPDGWVGFQHVV